MPVYDASNLENANGPDCSNTVWNSEFQFNVDNEDSLDLRIYDKDVGFDDFMGTAKIPLSHAFSSGSAKETVAVKTKDGKDKGTISVSLKFSGSGGHASSGHASHGDHGDHDDEKKHKKKKDKKEKKHGDSSSSSDSD